MLPLIVIFRPIVWYNHGPTEIILSLFLTEQKNGNFQIEQIQLVEVHTVIWKHLSKYLYFAPLYIVACQRGEVSNKPPWLQAATVMGQGSSSLLTQNT